MSVWDGAFLLDAVTVPMVTRNGEPGLDGNPLAIGKCTTCGHTKVVCETTDGTIVPMGTTDDCTCGGAKFVRR